jgi:hypothetical protein
VCFFWGERLSAITSWPSDAKSLHNARPINPVPPVTMTRMLTLFQSGFWI